MIFITVSNLGQNASDLLSHLILLLNLEFHLRSNGLSYLRCLLKEFPFVSVLLDT